MTLLSVENLSVIVSGRGGPLTVVRDMSFTLARGETLGVVGEIRQRQVDDGAGGHGPVAGRCARDRTREAGRRGAADGARGTALRAARQPHGDDLPGADDGAQSRAQHRRPGARRADAASRARSRRCHGGGRAAAGARRHSAGARAALRVSASALGRAAAARDDRDGAGVQARPDRGGRTDQCPRCDSAGADRGAAARCDRGDRHGADLDLARSRGDRAARRSRRRHVRRPGGGGRDRRRRFMGRGRIRIRKACSRRCRARGAQGQAAGCHSRHGAGPRRAAAGLPVPRPLSARAAGVS